MPDADAPKLTAEQAAAAAVGARAAAGVPSATALWDDIWESIGTQGKQGRKAVVRYIEAVTGKKIGELPIGRKAVRELTKLIQKAKAAGFDPRAAMGPVQGAIQKIIGVEAEAGTAGAMIAKRTNRPPTPGASGKLLKDIKPAGMGQKFKAFLGKNPWVAGLGAGYLASSAIGTGSRWLDEREALDQAVEDVQGQVRSPSQILRELAQEEALERRAARLSQGNPELAARLSQLAGGQPGGNIGIGGMTLPMPGAEQGPDLQTLLAMLGTE